MNAPSKNIPTDTTITLPPAMIPAVVNTPTIAALTYMLIANLAISMVTFTKKLVKVYSSLNINSAAL